MDDAGCIMAALKRKDRTASLKHERHYYSLGYTHIIGIDEVGRGPWAGPVTAGAVCLPIARDDLSKLLKGVRDSKKMTARQREALDQTIKDVAITWGIGSASSEEIDDLGIVPATHLAMRRALEEATKDIDFEPDALFLDDMLMPELRHTHQVSLIEGDSRTLSIAAASVIAKVHRDEIMLEFDAEFPHYGFAEHKGYGTAKHLQALKQFGILPIHRQYYAPIQAILRGDDSFESAAEGDEA